MNKQYQRNPVARAAILRKGGVHQKSRSSERQRHRQELDDGVLEYFARDHKEERKPQQTEHSHPSGWLFFCLSVCFMSGAGIHVRVCKPSGLCIFYPFLLRFISGCLVISAHRQKYWR